MRLRIIPHLPILIVIGLLIAIPGLGLAQTEFEITPQDPVYTFGDQIDFNASILFTEELDEVLLILQTNGDSDIQVYPVSIDGEGNMSLTIDLKEIPLRAFSNIEYWYQVNSTGGETYTTPRFSFYFGDNRYQWRTLEGEPFIIHWYAGDISFGEDVLNVALEGMIRTQEYMQVYFPENVDIFVYDSTRAMQDALPNSDRSWIAGHADPSQGVILVSLPEGPEQHLEMERQIPHELMHVALYYTDMHAYSNLPTWFNEGLASLAELYPNPEYQALIESAYDSGDLLPIAALCQAFPNDSQGALLAYAESVSFTQFLYEEYGNPGFNRLMAAYASGMNCERGVEEALGKDLASLEGSWWRENFSEKVWTKTLQDFLPWMILLLVVLAGPIILAIAVIRNRPKRMEL